MTSSCTREHGPDEFCWGCHPKTRPFTDEELHLVEQALERMASGSTPEDDR